VTHFGMEDFHKGQYIGIPPIASLSHPSSMVDYLSQILSMSSHPIQVHDSFPDEQLCEITKKEPPWYADIVNYLAISKTLSKCSKKVKD